MLTLLPTTDEIFDIFFPIYSTLQQNLHTKGGISHKNSHNDSIQIGFIRSENAPFLEWVSRVPSLSASFVQHWIALGLRVRVGRRVWRSQRYSAPLRYHRLHNVFLLLADYSVELLLPAILGSRDTSPSNVFQMDGLCHLPGKFSLSMPTIRQFEATDLWQNPEYFQRDSRARATSKSNAGRYPEFDSTSLGPTKTAGTLAMAVYHSQTKRDESENTERPSNTCQDL